MHDKRRRSAGEIAFNAVLFTASLALLWSAWRIAGFDSLSSPGALPMAVAATMVVSSGLILLDVWRHAHPDGTLFIRDILPPAVIVIVLFITGYALLLVPLGFIPTSLVFMVVSILYLRRGGIVFAVGVSVLALVLIYIVFRVIFTVLMPSGIVPEAEMISAFGRMLGGAN